MRRLLLRYKHAFLIGVVVLLALFGRSLGDVDGFEPPGTKDTLIRFAAVMAGASRNGVPVTLIDIDDATLEKLGGGDRAPRDFVADLASIVMVKKPLGTYVDLDTSRRGPSALADQKLTDFVARYPADAPFLLFARRFEEEAVKERASEIGLRPMPSILDETVRGRRNVVFVTSAAEMEDDRVLRRWQLTQTVCDGGQPLTFASPQLIAAAVNELGPSAPPAIDTYLAWRGARRCARDNPGQAPSWPRNPATRATISYAAGLSDAAGPKPGPAAELPPILRLSASALVSRDGGAVRAATVSDQLIAGRFVVIGSSHADSFDTHLTSIGYLPGAVVVANMIAFAPAVLQAVALPSFVRVMIALLLFIGLLLALKNFRGIVAAPLGGVLLLVSLLLLGRVLAPSNALEIVYTVLAMLAGFAALDSFAEVVEGFVAGKGWRALMKTPPPSGSGSAEGGEKV